VEKYVHEKWKDLQQVPTLKTGGEARLFPLIRAGDGTKVQLLLAEAQKLSEENKTSDAIQKLDDAIKANPRVAEAYRLRAWERWGLKEYDKALDDLDQALKLEPENAKLIAERGGILLANGDKNEAARQLKRALKMRPSDEYAAQLLGYVFIQQEKFQDAVDLYREVIDTNPGLAWAYYYRATALSKLKKLDDAMKDYDRAVDLDPHSMQYRDEHSDLAAKLGYFQDALNDAKRAEEIEPLVASNSNKGAMIAAQTYISIGDYWMQKGDSQAAQGAYARGWKEMDRVTQGEAQFQKKYENNALFRQNIDRLYSRFDNALDNGNISQANAYANKLIGQLPPSMRADARREWNEMKRDIRKGGNGYSDSNGEFGPPGGGKGKKGK
jgi:tetratricopeptide (TPR) repeat protein